MGSPGDGEASADCHAPTLPTDDPSLLLQPLSIDDFEHYFHLVDRNRHHLTRHGDYEFFRNATREDVRASLLDPSQPSIRFGLWYSGRLIGRLDLNPVNPPRWVIGYWIDERLTVRGLMTTACRAAVRHAGALGATEVYAGVTDGNELSVRVLERLGFEHIQDVAGRSRWRLALIPNPPPPFMVAPEASRSSFPSRERDSGE